jgi:methyl-accepting chemotaxis protein
MGNIANGMMKMEDGDLTARVTVETQDELGLLGAGFNRMVEKISDLLISTKEAIDAVKVRSGVMERNSEQAAQAATDVATAMEQISRGTLEQTKESEKTSVMMSELALLIDDTVGKAGEVEEITSSTRSLGVSTQEAIKTLIDKAQQADEIVHAFVDNIDQSDNSAQQISQITEAIATIAEQTNLLALNAAIEAARAGEAGRGFAVVADEVNKLASQTQEAARMIEGILQTIGKQTQLSKKTAIQVYQVVDEQNSAVDLTKEAFSEVVKAMDNVVTRMSAMTGNIGSINKLKEETVQAILNISTISEETSASAEEVSASAEEQTGMAEAAKGMAEALNTMAERLVETISHFVFENQE